MTVNEFQVIVYRGSLICKEVIFSDRHFLQLNFTNLFIFLAPQKPAGSEVFSFYSHDVTIRLCFMSCGPSDLMTEHQIWQTWIS